MAERPVFAARIVIATGPSAAGTKPVTLTSASADFKGRHEAAGTSRSTPPRPAPSAIAPPLRAIGEHIVRFCDGKLLINVIDKKLGY